MALCHRARLGGDDDLDRAAERLGPRARCGPTIPCDIVVNIQGDEPMLRPAHIAALLAPFDRPDIDAQVTTLWTRCTPEEIADSNAVKVVLPRRTGPLFLALDHSLRSRRRAEGRLPEAHRILRLSPCGARNALPSSPPPSAGSDRAAGTASPARAQHPDLRRANTAHHHRCGHGSGPGSRCRDLDRQIRRPVHSTIRRTVR